MSPCSGELHRHAGCWDEGVGVFRQGSSSRICLESLKEEGDLMGSWSVEHSRWGEDAVHWWGACLCVGSIQSHECFLSALWLCKQSEVSLEAAEFQSVVGAYSQGRCWISVSDFPPGLWSRLWSSCKGPEDNRWRCYVEGSGWPLDLHLLECFSEPITCWHGI